MINRKTKQNKKKFWKKVNHNYFWCNKNEDKHHSFVVAANKKLCGPSYVTINARCWGWLTYPKKKPAKFVKENLSAQVDSLEIL